MSIPLLKATIKSNWIIFLIFFAILLMYMTVMIGMYDPDNIDAMNQMVETLPQGMMDAFGYGDTATSLITFIALYYYGFIALMVPLIYCIIMANRLIAAHVDRGSMAYMLATFNTRISIVITQALFMAISVAVLLIMNTLAGIVISEAMFSGEMDIPAFLTLNLVTIMLNITVSSICFFFSCLFNEAKYSLAFGGGIPILFFIINMLSNIGGSGEWLKYLTIYTLFNPSDIVSGEQGVAAACFIFASIALFLYAGGVFIFNRRNLYI